MSYAKMQVMIEIEAPGSYGNEWKLDDLFKQTKREATHRLERALSEIGGKIIGEPEMIAVIVPRDSKP
jgi:hypothetical protein